MKPENAQRMRELLDRLERAVERIERYVPPSFMPEPDWVRRLPPIGSTPPPLDTPNTWHADAEQHKP